MAISPVGVMTRSIWDFYPAQIMAGAAAIPATGGQTSYIALYNNDSWGNYYWVIGLSCSGNLGGDANFEIIQTNPGGNVYPLTPTSIVSNAALLSGQLQTFYSAVCIGTHIGGASNIGQTTYIWPHDWPVAIVAPGQAFAIQTGGFSAQLSASLWWWVGPQP